MRVHRVLVFLFCFRPLFAVAQAKLEKIGAVSDPTVPAAVRGVLQDSGAKLVRPDGSVLCEVWLRKSLPPAKAVAGSGYPDLAPSMLVGVISFPNGGKDFRGQAIKPGFYTMRYELLPQDGNHMGVAPTRDFVLLVRAVQDADPNAQYDFAQLVKLSAQASGGNHPAPFVLLAPENSPTLSPANSAGDKGGPTRGTDKGGATTLPTTYQSPDGYQVFVGAIPTQAGKSVPIALVVKGQAEQ